MPRTVLVVDDSPTIRGFARLLLRSLDVKVVEAEDGAKALAAARASAPTLVLADVNMPVMDGLALTRELRKDRALKDVPVIAALQNAARYPDEVVHFCRNKQYSQKSPQTRADLRLCKIGSTLSGKPRLGIWCRGIASLM